VDKKKYKSKMAEYGSQGGKKSRGGGFAYMKVHDPGRLKEIARKARSTPPKDMEGAGGHHGTDS
jgi:general stress protein YciG